MSDYTLEQIMRAVAKGERNSVGDYWSTHWCENAANEIERLRAERDALAEALHRLEVTANTVGYCYDKRPENFASALRLLAGDAEAARAALAKLEGKQ